MFAPDSALGFPETGGSSARCGTARLPAGPFPASCPARPPRRRWTPPARCGTQGISTVFTKLGEALEDRDEIEKVMRHYTGLLERIAAERLNTQLSIKLTQLGQDLGQDLAQANLERLAKEAAHHRNVVWVDMEASPYVDQTLDIFATTLARHANLGLCVQAYLYRTPADVERLLAMGARLRLVKGAYREPAELAYPRQVRCGRELPGYRPADARERDSRGAPRNRDPRWRSAGPNP